MMDYMEFEDGYAMVKTTPPSAILGQSLHSADVRRRFGVTIVAIKRPGEDFTYARPETRVGNRTSSGAWVSPGSSLGRRGAACRSLRRRAHAIAAFRNLWLSLGSNLGDDWRPDA
jgi:hypothetical protein